jgi:hypothetical protein
MQSTGHVAPTGRGSLPHVTLPPARVQEDGVREQPRSAESLPYPAVLQANVLTVSMDSMRDDISHDAGQLNSKPCPACTAAANMNSKPFA